MYQVNFSNQSMAELNKLDVSEQMTLVEALSAVTPERLATDHAAIGAISRSGKTFYRLRVGELRVYFAAEEGALRCDYFLHKHTYPDFAFRMKLPFSEEQQIEQQQSFWQFLENDVKADTKPATSDAAKPDAK
jgi:mRNA-degrading endonuclease RelE of RelBE toxin-antitoxin system